MGLSVVTGPSAEALTLSEAKAHCRVDISDGDGLIAGYILAARHYVEGEIHRPIVSRMYDYTIGFGWPLKGYQVWIDLPCPPLLAVRSVSYVDASGATQVLSPSLYSVLTNRPRGAIVPAYNATWPEVRNQPEAITVRFVAGYTSFTDTTTSPSVAVSGPGVPDDLRQALGMLVGHWYENREAVISGPAVQVPLAVEAIISGYRTP
jgi:uncharacterized phiE125 gp8 family phage protein